MNTSPVPEAHDAGMSRKRRAESVPDEEPEPKPSKKARPDDVRTHHRNAFANQLLEMVQTESQQNSEPEGDLDSERASAGIETSPVSSPDAAHPTEPSLPLEHMNPLLAAYMDSVGLSEAELVPVRMENRTDHPALQLALEHLEDFLGNAFPPGFNTIHLKIDNALAQNGLTVTETAGQNHVDMSVRLKQKSTQQQMAGWGLATLLHETWAHALRDLSTGYLRSQGVDMAYSEQHLDHAELLTESYAQVAESLLSRIDNDEMREAFWKAVQADIHAQLFTLDGIEDELEEAVCERYQIDLEDDYSSGEEEELRSRRSASAE